MKKVMAKNNLLSKALSWFKKPAPEPEIEHKNQTLEVVKEQPALPAEPEAITKPQVVPQPALVIEPIAKIEPASAPQPTATAQPISQPNPAAPKAKVRQQEAVPIPSAEPPLQKIFEEGPEIKIVTKGSKVYAVCPHCEATWNLKERLLVYSTKRIAAALTCPSCDKAISLPVSLNLKKLSST